MVVRVLACAVAAVCIAFVAPVRAEVRAVLVGVSDYDDTIGLTDLKGPANDVTLLMDVLQARGVTDISLLADGVDGGQRPTRDAILAALADMANRAGPGDLVYVHMSGHGTRQGDPQGDETDGLDEVFLPADTARAEPGTNLIPNAIVDDELGRAVRAIRATGADVWLVLDSCHSGSGLRAASPGTATRFVDPAVLGVDIHTSHQSEDQIIEAETDQADDATGGFLAFYSARSSEVAREVNFSTEPGDEVWYGLFTAKLAARLQSGANLSYRQLFQAVLSDMNGDTVPGAARLQTPLWEGTLIDAAVFGGRATSGLRRFAVTGDAVQAGLVQGLSDGTVLGLVADAADDPDAIVGYAQMEDTSATRAYLRPVDPACVPHSTQPCDIVGTLPAHARFAQVMTRPVDLVVRIAPPRDLATGALLGDDSPALRALREAVATVNDGRDGRVDLNATDFSIETYWAEDQLWFGPRAVIGSRPVGLGVPPQAPALRAALLRIGKAEELARLLGSVTGKTSLLNPNPIRVSADLMPVNVNDLAAPGAGVSPRRECESALGRATGQAGPLTPGADLKQCDRLVFSAQGEVSGARDVNRVYIDSKFCIHAAHEHIEDTTAARRLGSPMMMCSDCPDGYSAGEERMFVIVTESEANTEPLNLEGLVENCTAPSAGTRGSAQGNVVSFLSGLSKRPDTRGTFGGVGVSNVWVQDFSWRVLPKTEAFLKAGRDPAASK